MKTLDITSMSYDYVMDAHMGDPSVPIKVIVDTGSTKAYMYSKDGCQANTCPPNNLLYDTEASQTFV